MYINVLNTYKTPRLAYHAINQALEQDHVGAKEDVFYLLYPQSAVDTFLNPPPAPEKPEEGQVYLEPADKDYWQNITSRFPHSAVENLPADKKERFQDLIHAYQTSLDEGQIVVIVDQDARA